MYNFEYQNPVKIIFGKGEIKKVGANIPKGAKILLTYGGGSIFKNNVYDQVKASIRGFDVIEFGGIEPNPHYETLMKAVEVVRKENITYLLSVSFCKRLTLCKTESNKKPPLMKYHAMIASVIFSSLS